MNPIGWQRSQPVALGPYLSLPANLGRKVRAYTYVGVVMVGTVVLCGCRASDGGDAATRSQTAIESMYTDLIGGACRREIDRTDPNETPYLVCPGVAGYGLIVRRVDAGRRSIDVVDAAQRAFPLSYHEVVTRHMFTLDPQAEWRVAAEDGEPVPIALIVRVQAHEDGDNPETVTSSYHAVAKITPDEVCVTDRIPDGEQSDAQVRRAADSAAERPCAASLPRMTEDGAVVR